MVEVLHTSTPAVPAYTVTARVLHWLVAALVLIMVPLGIVIANEWGGPVAADRSITCTSRSAPCCFHWSWCG